MFYNILGNKDSNVIETHAMRLSEVVYNSTVAPPQLNGFQDLEVPWKMAIARPKPKDFDYTEPATWAQKTRWGAIQEVHETMAKRTKWSAMSRIGMTHRINEFTLPFGNVVVAQAEQRPLQIFGAHFAAVPQEK